MQPRPVTQIRNLECSSVCDLACKYCIHAHKDVFLRPKQHMPWDVFQRSLVWIEHFVRQGSQGEINLSGTGEPTLHPRFAEMCMAVRKVIGPQGVLQYTTNGKSCTEALVQSLVPAQPKVCVTSHVITYSAPAAELYHKYGLLRGVSHDPLENPQDWAGQLKWPTRRLPGGKPVCILLDQGLGSIQANGVFTVCCMDGKDEAVIGTVWDDPQKTIPLMNEWRVCKDCWQAPPKH